VRRRNLLGALVATLAAGCSKVGKTDAFAALVDTAENMHRAAQRALGGRDALAKEFAPSDISPSFRGNGSTMIEDAAYRAHLSAGFVDWELKLTGLFERPMALSLEQLKALPQRTQITRHDCVEGWSAIGEWTGPELRTLLDMAGILPEARFVVFHCADTLDGARYYESVDLVDAYHPQTIIAHRLNGEPLRERNGAPLRMRIERQLGYKHAKYLNGIEAVASLDGIAGGKGGYWEDRGYQWYAGI
jgi:DMSO/TMAO reductase YedYZ molybdopterin-dependent catalytic subunit